MDVFMAFRAALDVMLKSKLYPSVAVVSAALMRESSECEIDPLRYEQCDLNAQLAKF
jgi:hypothetical protein